MHRFAATLLVVGFSLIGASPSQAMPMAPIDGQSDLMTQIAGGCGRGWHRGPFGGCRRNFANPRAHACPRGYHIGPGGRCRGNGR